MFGRSPHFSGPSKVILRGIGFSLWILVSARTNPHRLKPMPQAGQFQICLGKKRRGLVAPATPGRAALRSLAATTGAGPANGSDGKSPTNADASVSEGSAEAGPSG